MVTEKYNKRKGPRNQKEKRRRKKPNNTRKNMENTDEHTHTTKQKKEQKVKKPHAKVASGPGLGPRLAPKQQWRPSRRPILSAAISDLGSHGGRKAIARCPCTPQGPMEACGEKINVSFGPSKEIAGLKKKKMMKIMTPG